MSYQHCGLTWEVYRKFLEESGIKYELTRLLFELWEEPEKPPDLEHYVRKNFSKQKVNAPNITLLRKNIAWKRAFIEHLKKRNKKLRVVLSFYQNPTFDHLVEEDDDDEEEEENDEEGEEGGEGEEESDESVAEPQQRFALEDELTCLKRSWRLHKKQ